MDGDKDPMVNPDKTPNDGNNGGEETTSGNLFRDDDETTEVTPGSSRNTTFKGGEEDKTGDAETSLSEGNVPPERVFKSAQTLKIWKATSKLKNEFPKMKEKDFIFDIDESGDVVAVSVNIKADKNTYYKALTNKSL